MAMETVPNELRNLRACLLCSLIKTLEQFDYDGCDNCDKYIKLKGNKENIMSCTSQIYDGIVSIITPEDSWVARWQRTDKMVKGCYAISVSGKLPNRIIQDLKARGVPVINRDRALQH